jgi:UDP-2,3-diacylglucosamine hydrolase
MASHPAPASTGWAHLHAPPGWQAVDCISDLHLHADDPVTALWWRRYLELAPFDALFILGDLFEVWVGDDVLATHDDDPGHAFIRTCCSALQACAARRPVHVMRGNRDFLLGPGFFQATGTHELTDPTALALGSTRWLLSHGDAWCLDDLDYMRFRAEVRTEDWQTTFLARPLAEREALARDLRRRSEALRHDPSQRYADVDADTARHWLRASACTTLIHGHTHRPGSHALGDGLQRLVLSDWDASAHPPRAEVLRLHADGRCERLPLEMA